MTTTLAPAPALRTAGSAWLFRFAAVLAVLTLLLIKWGALVVSSGSGMAFLDWPLSRGSLWPPEMTKNELLEHVHRVYGAVIGVCALVQWLWTCRIDPRGWLRKLTFGFGVLVLVQGLFGALGVRMGEAGGVTHPVMATVHGVLGQVTLCLQVFIAFALSSAFGVRTAADREAVLGTRKLARTALAAVFVQLVIGAIFRHTNVHGVLWVHITMALVVSVLILLAAAHSSARFGDVVPAFRRTAVWFYALLILQLTLGFVAITVRKFKDSSSIDEPVQILLVSSHVLVGASIFALATLLVARAQRNLSPRVESP